MKRSLICSTLVGLAFSTASAQEPQKEEIRKALPNVPGVVQEPDGSATDSVKLHQRKEEPKVLKPESRPDLEAEPKLKGPATEEEIKPKGLPEPPPKVLTPAKSIPKPRPDLPRAAPTPPKALKLIPESPKKTTSSSSAGVQKSRAN